MLNEPAPSLRLPPAPSGQNYLFVLIMPLEILKFTYNFHDNLRLLQPTPSYTIVGNLATMSESQIPTEERLSAVEPQDASGGLGEPGIANRKTSGAVPWESDHPINLRLTIPLLSKRYYVTIVAGEEHRGSERLSVERRKHPLVTRGNLVFFALVGTVMGLSGLALIQFATMYLLDQSGALVP